jgi:hypothetical protein
MRVIGLWAVVGVVLVGSTAVHYSQREIVTTKVIDTEIKRVSSSSDRYIVFTDSEVFENTDDLFLLKFDSADVQNAIIQYKGKTCSFDVVGYRFPLLSMNRNIVNVTDCK